MVGAELFKMRTDGMCLSIIYKEYYSSVFFAEDDYFYLWCAPHPNANAGISEIRFSRISLNGDRYELIYSNKFFWSSHASVVYNDKLYVAVLKTTLPERSK